MSWLISRGAHPEPRDACDDFTGASGAGTGSGTGAVGPEPIAQEGAGDGHVGGEKVPWPLVPRMEQVDGTGMELGDGTWWMFVFW